MIAVNITSFLVKLFLDRSDTLKIELSFTAFFLIFKKKKKSGTEVSFFRREVTFYIRKWQFIFNNNRSVILGLFFTQKFHFLKIKLPLATVDTGEINPTSMCGWREGVVY